MNSIQLSIDIATSLSVVVAVITFVLNQNAQSRAVRLLAVKQQRIEQRSRLVEGFAKILEDGHKVAEKVGYMQAGRDVEISPDAYTHFCHSIMRHIQINSKLLFEVWASEEEKKIMESISNLTFSWNNEFVEAARKAAIEKDWSTIPSFTEFLEDIGNEVAKLSSLLRKEVERANV